MFEHKRLVTILYADISGFTELTNKIGAEKTTDFINECFNAIDGIIHRYNGHVIVHEGDRVMTVFGYPHTFGDDSSNALFASLKIKDEIKNMRENVDVHIGVGSGTVLVRDDKIYGQLIDEVSGLEERAKSNEILVNNACYNINKQFFDFREEEDGFQLIGSCMREKKSPVIFDIYGNEFTQINDAVFKTPQFIVVAGQKGIGKSTFIHYSLAKINTENQFRIYELNFAEYSSIDTPFLNVVYKIKPDFSVPRTDKLEGEDYRLRLFSEMADLLLHTAKEVPLVIILKNFGVIDTTSISFLEMFVRAIKDEKIVLIFEIRNKKDHPFEKLLSHRHINSTMIELNPLSNEVVIKIIKHILSNYHLTDDFKREAIALCQGNPFYAVEIAHFIKDAYAPESVLKEIPFVNNIQQITQAIIDTIPEHYLSGLLMLNLLHREIDRSLCHNLIPDAEAFLDFCIEKNLLYSDGENLFFKSNLIKRALSLLLSRNMAQSLHQKIAQVLKSSKNIPENYGIIAYHLKEANNLKESVDYLRQWADHLYKDYQYDKCLVVFNDILNMISQEQVEERLEFLLKRIDLLHILGYREQELQEIENAFRIATESNKEQFYRRINYARACYLEATADYDGALQIYDELYKREKDISLLEKIGMNHYYKNDLNTAMDIFEQLMEMLEGSNDSLLRGRVLSDFGLCYWKKGEKERALYYYTKARADLEKANDMIGMSRLLTNIANVYYDQGKIEQGLVNYQKALKIAYRTNNPSLTAQILSNMGGIYVQRGDYEAALKNFNEALKVDHKNLNRRGEAIRLSNIGCIYGLFGDTKTALGYFLEALHLDEGTKNLSGMAIRLGNIANCFIEDDDYQKAIDYFSRALKLSEEMDLKEYLAYYHTNLGLALLKAGQLEKARKHLFYGKEISTKSKIPSYEVIAHSNLGLYYLKIGDKTEALSNSNWAIDRLSRLSDFEGNKEQVYLTHYEILKDMDKKIEANFYLKMAYDEIINKAKKIANPEFQEKFLNTKKNKKIIELWRQAKNQG